MGKDWGGGENGLRTEELVRGNDIDQRSKR